MRAYNIPSIQWYQLQYNIDGCCLLFEENLLGKTSLYTLKPCREIGQSFIESLRGVKCVKNFEIF